MSCRCSDMYTFAFWKKCADSAVTHCTLHCVAVCHSVSTFIATLNDVMMTSYPIIVILVFAVLKALHAETARWIGLAVPTETVHNMSCVHKHYGIVYKFCVNKSYYINFVFTNHIIILGECLAFLASRSDPTII